MDDVATVKMATVTMVHRRLGKRTVNKAVVRKMRQNGWTVEGEPAPAEAKADTPKGKSSKETE